MPKTYLMKFNESYNHSTKYSSGENGPLSEAKQHCMLKQ